MQPLGLTLYFALVAVAIAQPGYRYQQPSAGPQPQPIRQNQRPPQQSNNVYAGQQSPPLVQYAPPAPQPQPGPVQQVQSQPIIAQPPVQLPIPQQAYLPPQPIQSIAQSHQSQQIVQQQLSLPIGQPLIGSSQLSLPIAPQQQSFQPQQSFQQQQSFQSYQRPQTAIITKDIYIHSAPDDQEENSLGQQLDNAPIRKNYRIVFIKAPSQNLKLATAALKHAQVAQEEKTVIYVLSKKPDLSEVHQQLQQAQGQQKAHKPEVYFIKYKTQEEAQRAQQEIQAQYDALGGSTHISDEGVAPVTSVIGSAGGALNLGGSIGGGGVQQQQSFVQQNFQSQSSVGYAEAPSNKYLPAKKK